MSHRQRGKGSEEEQRVVRISKALSSTLRHNAKSEGLKLQPDGYANVDELINLAKYQKLGLTFDILKQVVAENNKKRFKIIKKSDNIPKTSEVSASTSSEPAVSTDPTVTSVDPTEESAEYLSGDPSDYLIRAVQGHSIAIESSLLLTPITAENPLPVCIHASFYGAVRPILESDHLSRMSRTHIHFAPGLPKPTTHPLTGEEIPAVISGMRFDAEVLFYIEIERALEDGVKFWMSDNGVVLTEGVDGNGQLPMKYVERIEDYKGSAGGGNLWTRAEGEVKSWPEGGRQKRERGGGGGGGRGRGGGGGGRRGRS